MSGQSGCDKQDCVTLLRDYEERLKAIAEMAAQGRKAAFYERSTVLDKIYRIAAGRPQISEENAER